MKNLCSWVLKQNEPGWYFYKNKEGRGPFSIADNPIAVCHFPRQGKLKPNSKDYLFSTLVVGLPPPMQGLNARFCLGYPTCDSRFPSAGSARCLTMQFCIVRTVPLYDLCYRGVGKGLTACFSPLWCSIADLHSQRQMAQDGDRCRMSQRGIVGQVSILFFC